MTTTPSTRTKVLISYSHADKEWLERLKRHLKPLVREGRLEYWDDTHIQPGDDWQQEIRTALDTSRIAVLLISADFFASDFIDENELPALLAAAQVKGVRILPVIISASRFARLPDLARFQAINSPDWPLAKMSPAEQEDIFNYLAQTIMAAFDPHVSTRQTDTNRRRPGGRSAVLTPLPETPGRLWTRQRRVLAEKIIKFSSLRDVEQRKDLGEQLERELGNEITLAIDNALEDIMGILFVACRTKYGIEVLSNLLDNYIYDKKSFQFIEGGLERLLWVGQVFQLLRGIPFSNADLQKLYRLSCPDNQLAPDARDLNSIIETLLQMPPRYTGAIEPLFEFIGRTAYKYDSGDLRSWLEDNVSGKGLLADLWDKLEQEEFSYLLIDIPAQTTTIIQYWLLDRKGSNYICSFHNEIELDASNDDLRTIIKQALDEVEKFSEAHLIVEVFLSREMICCDVDQWERHPKVRLGEMYPVVVRWRDRAEWAGQKQAGPWKRVASRIHQHLNISNNKVSTFWVAADGMSIPTFIRKLDKGDYGGCVGFLFVPNTPQLGDEMGLLDYALLNGMPFGFWLRREPPNWQDFQKDVDALLSNHCCYLNDIPLRLYERRVEKDQSKPVYSFTVFWDDPERNPLILQLEMVGQRG